MLAVYSYVSTESKWHLYWTTCRYCELLAPDIRIYLPFLVHALCKLRNLRRVSVKIVIVRFLLVWEISFIIQNLKNVSRGLKISRGSSMVGST